MAEHAAPPPPDPQDFQDFHDAAGVNEDSIVLRVTSTFSPKRNRRLTIDAAPPMALSPPSPGPVDWRTASTPAVPNLDEELPTPPEEFDLRDLKPLTSERAHEYDNLLVIL